MTAAHAWPRGRPSLPARRVNRETGPGNSRPGRASCLPSRLRPTPHFLQTDFNLSQVEFELVVIPREALPTVVATPEVAGGDGPSREGEEAAGGGTEDQVGKESSKGTESPAEQAEPAEAEPQ